MPRPPLFKFRFRCIGDDAREGRTRSALHGKDFTALLRQARNRNRRVDGRSAQVSKDFVRWVCRVHFGQACITILSELEFEFVPIRVRVVVVNGRDVLPDCENNAGEAG